MGPGAEDDPRTVAPAGVEIGDVLAGRYEVVRPLGEGGMGAVYEVLDRELDEPVALKLLHPAMSHEPDYRARLRSEVRLARRVSHPNVCRVHDLGQHGDRLFVTMELLGGRTLRDSLRAIDAGDEPPLGLGRKIDLVVQLCAALSAAHRVGIVHGDVKPENLIVEPDRAVLTDFGVASPFDVRRGRRLVAGTPHYIAPEILRGEAGGPRADLYAVGLVAYELLAGRPPFRTSGLREAMERARAVPTVPPLGEDAAPAHCRAGLDRVLARALDGWPGSRPETVDRFAEALALAARGASPEELGLPRPSSAGDGAATILDSDVHAAPDGGDDAARALPRVATALQVYFGGRSAPLVDAPDTATFDREHPRDSMETEAATRATEPSEPGDLDQLERVVRDHGGHLVASGAAELMAIFGAPRALGDDAVRAARAAFALVDRGGRAGLHTGRVELSWQPGGLRARGDAIDRARALARAAPAGQVVASLATSRHFVGRFGTSETHGQGRLVVPGLLARAERFELPPLHGREPELERLTELIRDACEARAPRAALVIGPPGSGKSRLRLEMERVVAERREVEWLRARAGALGERDPFGLLRSASPAWFEAVAAASAVGGRPAALAAARAWLESRASVRPVVVVLDDVQWADRASLEVLSQLRRASGGVPIAIAMFARDDRDADGAAERGPAADPTPDDTIADAGLDDGDQAAAGGGAEVTGPDAEDAGLAAPSALHAADFDRVIELGPLADAAMHAIARRLAPEASDASVAELVERAGGNPFFGEELARHLGESTEPARRGDLPAAVELVVQARLDRLPPAARRLAHAASVIGRDFDRAGVRAVLDASSPIDEAALDAALVELERRQIVALAAPAAAEPGATGTGPGAERYLFHHALTRDVAYAQLDDASRQRAHAALALHLERSPGRREPGRLLVLAQHREAAGDRAGARDAYREAGLIALSLYAHREASEALLRAEALGDGPDAALAEMVGDALLPLDGAAAAGRYQAALALTSDRIARARLYHRLGEAAAGRADGQAAVACFETGLALLGTDAELDRADPSVRALAARLLGSLGWLVGYEMGDHRRGLPQAERAVALLESHGDVKELAQALSRLAANHARAGRWRDRLRCNLRHLEIAEAAGDLHQQLIAHINLGDNYTSLGELDAAAAHTREAAALAARTGRLAERALAHHNLGLILADAGDDAAARAELDEAVRLGARVGYTRFLRETHGVLAQLAARAGDLAGAEREAREAVARARETGSPIDEGIGLRLVAAVVDRIGGRDAEAAALFADAERLTADEPYEAARTRAALAKRHARAGRAEEAAALRERAAEVFRDLGASLDLARLDDPHDLR